MVILQRAGTRVREKMPWSTPTTGSRLLVAVYVYPTGQFMGIEQESKDMAGRRRGSGRRKVGRKKRRMRAKIRHRK